MYNIEQDPSAEQPLLPDDAATPYDPFAIWYDLAIPDQAAYLEFYPALIEPGQRSLLDIGCGTGTITAAMAERLRALSGGWAVRAAGLDGSAGMLERARARDPGIAWHQGDMRAIPPIGPFDLVTCTYNPLQHLDATGLGRCFRSVRAVLAPAGRFAFDLYRPNLPYLRRERRDDPVRVVVGPDGRPLQLLEDSVFEEEALLLRLTWRLRPLATPDAPAAGQVEFRLFQHAPQVIEAALAAAGFAILQRWGDLDRSPWHQAARKQVLVCRAV